MNLVHVFRPKLTVRECCALLGKRASRSRAIERRVRKDPPTKRYVLANQGKVAKQVLEVFARWPKRIAEQVVKKAGKADLGRLVKGPEDDRGRTIDDIIATLDLGDFSAELTDTLRATLEEAAQAGGLSGLQLIDMAESPEIVNLVNQAAVDFSQARAAELVTQIDESTRDFLRLAVTDAVQSGSSVDELASALEDGPAFSDARAETIARTELANAHVQGNLQAWDASGQVEGKMSILGDDHPEIDECDANADAGVIDLNDNFPSGDDGPPYHPRCVCDLVPVLNDEGA